MTLQLSQRALTEALTFNGSSFSIEPGIYLSSFGVRSEINVVITPGNQVKVTTPPQQDLVRLV